MCYNPLFTSNRNLSKLEQNFILKTKGNKIQRKKKKRDFFGRMCMIENHRETEQHDHVKIGIREAPSTK